MFRMTPATHDLDCVEDEDSNLELSSSTSSSSSPSDPLYLSLGSLPSVTPQLLTKAPRSPLAKKNNGCSIETQQDGINLKTSNPNNLVSNPIQTADPKRANQHTIDTITNHTLKQKNSNFSPLDMSKYKSSAALERLANMKPKNNQKQANFDPLCFIHSKFDGIVDMPDDLTALSFTSNPNHSSSSLSISPKRLVKTASNVRELAKQLGKASIDLHAVSIMIVTKARDNSLVYLTRELAYWLIRDAKKTVYVDAKLQKSRRFGASSLLEKLENSDCCQNSKCNSSNLRYWTKKQAIETPEAFDLAITLGGDGTVLYLSKLFQRIVPPTIAFSLGSLGFLTNFRIEDAQKVLSRIFSNGINVNLRMRFHCKVYSHDKKLLASHEVLNEIVIDRGPSPWVSMLELYGDDSLLTVVQADGLILSTPTGSTAYSLSAGGSLVHPEVSAISVTPICPHTLSFRPMLLPDSMVLRVTVPKNSRSTAWASFDGHDRMEIKPGYCVTVSASRFPFPTIVSSPTEYIDSVSRILKWNVRQHQKPFEHLLLASESNAMYQNLDLKHSMSESEREYERKRRETIEEEEYERMKPKSKDRNLNDKNANIADSDQSEEETEPSFDIDYDDDI